MIRKLYQRVLVGFFFAALSAPLIAYILGQGPDSAVIRFVERRVPASRPELELTSESIATFPKRADTYWNDFFGFRHELVALHGRLRLALGASVATPSERREVLIGRDGWLFLANEEEVLRQFRGVDTFSPGELANWVDYLRRLHDWCSTHDVKFVCAIPPNKHTIYPEHLPKWVLRNRMGPGELDQVEGALGGEDWFLDLRPALRAAKEAEPFIVYSKTDSHWNLLGGYWGYRAIMERLFGPASNVPRIERKDIHIVIGDETAMGLSSALGVPKVLYERPIVVRLPDTTPKTAAPASLRSDSPRRVLVIGDSYFMGLRPFFEATFPEVQFIHHGHWARLHRLVKRARPDVVVLELVERMLNNADIALELEESATESRADKRASTTSAPTHTSESPSS